MESNRWLRALLILLVIIAAWYLLGIVWQMGAYFADTLLLFFLAWLLAFTLAPLVRLLTRIRFVPRSASVIGIYVALLPALALLLIVVAPISISQIVELGGTLPSYVERLPEAQGALQGWLDARGIPLQLSGLYERQTITEWAQTWGSSLGQYALGAAQGTALVMVEAIIVLMLSFYIMLDGERIFRGVLRLVPNRYRDDARVLRASLERTFGGYIRGSLVMAVIYGPITALVMWQQGLSFVLPVSAVSGAMIMIPFIGPIVALVLPVIVAAFTGSIGMVLTVFVVLLVVQQAMLQVIYPKLMSESVGIHPLLVFVAVLAGAKIAGIWGILFGVPILAALYSMAMFFYERANGKGAQSVSQPRIDG